MSALLIAAGVIIFFLSWRFLHRVSDKKVSRHFSPWWPKSMGGEDAEAWGIATGALFGVFALFAGVVLILIGVVKIFR